MSLKEQVLDALLGGETISGELLAERFGVSRSAVWKAVGRLRQDGFAVEATTNRGYRLRACEGISEAVISRAGDGGFALEVHDRIGSTNDRAKQLAAEGAGKVCVIADRQESGKGRMGRSFFSPPGTGLYLSLVLRPSLRGEDAALLTTFAAVAVAETVEAMTGAKAAIKWVNDVYVGGKKVCGILTEGSVDFESGGFSYAVVGIGVNLRKCVRPPELASVATDLESETGVRVDRSLFASALLRRFADVERVLRERSFLDAYRARCFVLGKDVTVFRGSERFSARAVDVGPRGELLVDPGDGVLRALQSGEVSVRVKPE